MDEFCMRLRKLPSCRSAVFVFVIEANLDFMRAKFIAQHTTEQMYFPCVTMREDPKDLERPGVWMTAPRKVQMNADATFFMQMESLHVLPLQNRRNHLVGVGRTEDIQQTARLFQDQMKSYRLKIDKNSDPSKEAKGRYTGKSAGSKDDMVIAFQLALTWGMAFLDDPDYVTQFNAQPVSVLARIRPPFNEVYDVVPTRNAGRFW